MTNAEIFAKVIGRTVRLYREVRGISLSKMATDLGYAHSGWSRVETGESVMTVVQLFNASKLLGVEPHDLVKSAMGMMFDPTTKSKRPSVKTGERLGIVRCGKNDCDWNLLEGDCPDHAMPIQENR
ncbi:MAG: helix-turn-helix domain-containing protein [Methanomassiliicoccales archaeon]|nr:helix-turn-helix domain-containing protein [Methanomassiliicoccales archaeon]